MSQYYAFACTNCGQNLRATREDAQNRVRPGGGITLYRYMCPICHSYFLIKNTAMLPIATPQAINPDREIQELVEQTEDTPEEIDGGIRRIGLVRDHFRAYQYGEPYEGKPVAMRHGFDIVDANAEVILLGLEVLEDLREVTISIDASVNARIREKMFMTAAKKVKEFFRED